MAADIEFDRAGWQGAPIIDAHAHLGPYDRFHIPNPDGDSMVRVMDRCGVALAIVSSLRAVELDTPAGNAQTAALCAAHPGRFAGYIVVNPWQDPIAELDRWRENGAFVGVKIHPDLHQYPLDGPRYRAVWEYAKETGRPVLTHTWAGSPYDDLSHVERVSDAYPEAWILAGHSGVAPASFDDAIALAQRHSKVVLELCGSHNHGRWVTEFVDRVGAGQVVFGSDFPFIDLRMSLGRVLFAELSDSDREAVLGKTILSIIGDSRPGLTH